MGWQIGFDRPWFLLLLAFLPVLWLLSFRSLAGLGRSRRLLSLALRTAVFAMLVLALAEVQFRRVSDRVTVLFLLDQSESIPRATRDAMIKYVMKEVELHRRKGDLKSASEDKAGVIIFGREATIEYPPLADAIRSVGNLESLAQVRTDATSIESALKLALASFPEDSAKRVVIVTDGNENLGDARTKASMLVERGIGIDVVPISVKASSEVAVEKIVLPSDIRRGQKFEARVVLQNQTDEEGGAQNKTVRGKLRVMRKFGENEEVLVEEVLDLPPGKSVKTFEHQIDSPAAYTYEARFIPEDSNDDLLSQNNAATAFTHVRGKGRVLLIEEDENKGDFSALTNSLQKMNIEVDVRTTARLFSSLAELQAYDCVVLANTKRGNIRVDDSTGAILASDGFTDEQIQMLVRNTEQFGCGLVMIGGPNSFGAGGWTNTALEKAMPVDFQIQNAKVRAVGALAMMMHASEIADGNHWQKVIGQEALNVLGPMDFCGVVHWDDFTAKESWLWPKGIVQIGDQKKSMLARIDRMRPGDMPDFEPAMRMTLKDMVACPASVKHCIIISDGDPTPASANIIGQFRKAQIKISTVAVGAHGPAGHKALQDIASGTGGKYYVVTNPKALPRIFAIEARRVARPLVKEDAGGIPIVVNASQKQHEMLGTIAGDIPPIKGFVLTTVKENPLVEVLLRADTKEDPSNNTILAGWTYGAGRTAVVTTDGGAAWANSWTAWASYDKFFSQVIRWSMRPINEDQEGGKFSVASDVKDGKVRVIVTALDKEDQFLNFLNMSAAGTGPDMEDLQLSLRQDAPGRYVGEFPAEKSGSYLLAIQTGKKGSAPILAGVDVPYSAEYRQHSSNGALLENLASLKPKGGEAGKVIEGSLQPEELEQMTKIDTFRRSLPKAISSQDVWPLVLLLTSGIFFFDVMIRRVAITFEWVGRLRNWVLEKVFRRPVAEAPSEAMQSLRKKKEAISQQIDERRAATRFDPQANPLPDDGQSAKEILETAATASSPDEPQRPTSSASASAKEEESYTERLLAAKRKAQKDSQK
ncbi:MAG: VWA domain-containing protein [Pirellulales bacterium]